MWCKQHSDFAFLVSCSLNFKYCLLSSLCFFVKLCYIMDRNRELNILLPKNSLLRKKRKLNEDDYQSNSLEIEFPINTVNISETNISFDNEADEDAFQSDNDDRSEPPTDLQIVDCLNKEDDETFQLHINFNKNKTLLKILNHYVRHNQSFTELEDMLKLFNGVLETKALPESKYLILKHLPKDALFEIHQFCAECRKYIGKEVIQNECSGCNKEIKPNKKDGEFFITLSVKFLIEKVVDKYFDVLDFGDDGDDIVDIHSGKLYINLKKRWGKFISLTFNTDGVQIFNSNKKGFWPLQAVINEIPKHSRFKEENIIVFGFLYGPQPPMEIFLKPFLGNNYNLLNLLKY